MRTIAPLRALVAVSGLAGFAACGSDTTTAPIPTRPALAVATQCRNVDGSIGESLTMLPGFGQPADLEGSIAGDITGQAFGKITTWSYKPKNNSYDITLEHRFVMPDGEIHTSDKASLKSTDAVYHNTAGWSTFDGRLTITSGTGAYAGASGVLRVNGIFGAAITVNYPFDGLQLTYAGRLCLPT